MSGKEATDPLEFAPEVQAVLLHSRQQQGKQAFDAGAQDVVNIEQFAVFAMGEEVTPERVMNRPMCSGMAARCGQRPSASAEHIVMTTSLADGSPQIAGVPARTGRMPCAASSASAAGAKASSRSQASRRALSLELHRSFG